ncbi:hypothetical protein D6783_03800 [Candidatus Woesearchaeota archaeon]|nr:MAG: hypothetical protein D6783_03800 [Candidatus Woesearchaeota archaeon]
MVLQIVGFFLILVEVLKLSRLIRQEKYDISRFEKDLAGLEAKGEHKKESPSQALQDYVNKALAKGVTVTEIRQKLQERGWKEEQINAVLPQTASASPETLTTTAAATSTTTSSTSTMTSESGPSQMQTDAEQKNSDPNASNVGGPGGNSAN